MEGISLKSFMFIFRVASKKKYACLKKQICWYTSCLTLVVRRFQYMPICSVAKNLVKRSLLLSYPHSRYKTICQLVSLRLNDWPLQINKH